jgi:hypothetical protein
MSDVFLGARKLLRTIVRVPLERAGLSDRYNDAFFAALRQGSERSAAKVLPIVLDLVRPRSAIDIGCGEGAWLSVMRRLGVEDVVGVDGGYVDRSRLAIPQELFVPHDLNTPYRTSRRFDLAMTLETGEHIEPQNSAAFVDMLIGLAPVVLFSAAAPFQGGRNHVNERWPDFWIGLFGERGYQPVDCIRSAVWNDPDVEYWYAQNLFIFLDRARAADYPKLIEEGRRRAFPVPSVIHPRGFLQSVKWGWTRKSLTTSYTAPGSGSPPGEKPFQ